MDVLRQHGPPDGTQEGDTVTSSTRRTTAVALVVLALAGLPAASALGADVPGPELFVGRSGTDGCGSSAVDVAYDLAYDADLAGYAVTAARLSGLDERCLGYAAVVSLTGAGGVRLAEMRATVDGERLRVAVPAGSPVAAERLTGVSVVLEGGA